MPLGPYQGQMLSPGMGSPVYTTEHDLSGLLYGSPHHSVYLTHSIVDGTSRDAGNTADTTVLRVGLVMAQVTATKKWKPFAEGASDGTEIPMGILTLLGLNTQLDGGDTDRFLATIMVKGCINPEALCIASTAAYGLDKTTAAHITVRKAFKYAFGLSDDFMAYVPEALSAR